jgi:hypothetical protein
MPHKAGTILTTALLLVLFLVQGILFIHANSQTYDEATHLAAGYSYLNRQPGIWPLEWPPLPTEFQQQCHGKFSRSAFTIYRTSLAFMIPSSAGFGSVSL